MLKTFRDSMRKGYNSIAKINPEDMKPTKFDMNLTDLGKMHNLRMWYMENSPNQSKRFQYLRELEILHDEINYMSNLKIQKRILLLSVGLLTYYFIWMEPDCDKYEYSGTYDMKHATRSFANLEDGGFEVVV